MNSPNNTVQLSLIIKFLLYLNTLRYLKPKQIYRRFWFHLVRPRVNQSFSPSLRKIMGDWVPSANRKISLIEKDTFIFLNSIGRLSEMGWDSQHREKLWRYNIHYFDDLNSLDAHLRTKWHLDLLLEWVDKNKPGKGTGWEPYPTSLRIVNWVKWHCAGNVLPRKCIQSLAIQAHWLSNRIEWHILGNHLFGNAKALVFAGLFFDGSESQDWLNEGLQIIANELNEQVLKDGGNFERSPMYHSIFLEDLLDLINLSQTYPGVVPKDQFNDWRRTASKMLDWLVGMLHPDGEISFFNDAAIGVAPTPAELLSYAKLLNVVGGTKSADASVMHFPFSGYVRLEKKDVVVLLDVAPIGPDYLPGHAHADTLSFELSLFGQRVFVNGGTSEYGNGPIRLNERGTSSHNTVEIDGENSSEVWEGFRVANRAYPFGLNIEKALGYATVCCAHDGYRRFHGNTIHWREWCLSDKNLVIRDRVEGAYDKAIARFHLHPDLKVIKKIENLYSFRMASGKNFNVNVEEGNSRLESGFYAPEFGKRLDSTCLMVELGKKGSNLNISWRYEN